MESNTFTQTDGDTSVTMGVTKYKPDGSFWYWAPYNEYIARKFAYEIIDRCSIGPRLWGYKPIEGQKRYEIAKEIYEKDYKDVLPISNLEYYNTE